MLLDMYVYAHIYDVANKHIKLRHRRRSHQKCNIANHRLTFTIVLEVYKSKLTPYSYQSVYALSCSYNAEYIGETKKKEITRTIEHQQDSIKRKLKTSSATERCLKCHGQFNWYTQRHY